MLDLNPCVCCLTLWIRDWAKSAGFLVGKGLAEY